MRNFNIFDNLTKRWLSIGVNRESIPAECVQGLPELMARPSGNAKDEDITMTDFDGNLRQAFAFAGGALDEISGNLFALSGEVDDLAQKVDDIYADYSAALGVI